MSAANEVREKVAYSLLTISTLLLLFGLFTNSSWSFFALMMGSGLFVMGAVMFSSLSIIKGVPWLTRLISRHLEPVWDGELLHTDGSGFKVRYDFDNKGQPWFVASDVCLAVGLKAPRKDDLKCGGVPLLIHGEYASFSEETVQTFLVSLAINNHDASRLLTLIRNNVLRKLEKQRDDKKRYG
jgi:hypothetical protein